MRRAGTINLLLALALALLLAACGSSTPATAGDDAAAAPTDASADVTPAAEDGGGNAGAGVVDIPAIADAMYKSGKAHLEVTGDKSLSADPELAYGSSITTNGSTLLNYLVGNGQDAVIVSIAITPETGAGVSVQSADFMLAGGAEEGCRLDLTRNDASGIGGSVVCPGIRALVQGGLVEADTDATVTFSADR